MSHTPVASTSLVRLRRLWRLSTDATHTLCRPERLTARQLARTTVTAAPINDHGVSTCCVANGRVTFVLSIFPSSSAQTLEADARVIRQSVADELSVSSSTENTEIGFRDREPLTAPCLEPLHPTPMSLQPLTKAPEPEVMSMTKTERRSLCKRRLALHTLQPSCRMSEPKASERFVSPQSAVEVSRTAPTVPSHQGEDGWGVVKSFLAMPPGLGRATSVYWLASWLLLGCRGGHLCAYERESWRLLRIYRNSTIGPIAYIVPVHILIPGRALHAINNTASANLALFAPLIAKNRFYETDSIQDQAKVFLQSTSGCCTLIQLPTGLCAEESTTPIRGLFSNWRHRILSVFLDPQRYKLYLLNDRGDLATVSLPEGTLDRVILSDELETLRSKWLALVKTLDNITASNNSRTSWKQIFQQTGFDFDAHSIHFTTSPGSKGCLGQRIRKHQINNNEPVLFPSVSRFFNLAKVNPSMSTINIKTLFPIAMIMSCIFPWCSSERVYVRSETAKIRLQQTGRTLPLLYVSLGAENSISASMSNFNLVQGPQRPGSNTRHLSLPPAPSLFGLLSQTLQSDALWASQSHEDAANELNKTSRQNALRALLHFDRQTTHTLLASPFAAILPVSANLLGHPGNAGLRISAKELLRQASLKVSRFLHEIITADMKPLELSWSESRLGFVRDLLIVTKALCSLLALSLRLPPPTLQKPAPGSAKSKASDDTEPHTDLTQWFTPLVNFMSPQFKSDQTRSLSTLTSWMGSTLAESAFFALLALSKSLNWHALRTTTRNVAADGFVHAATMTDMPREETRLPNSPDHPLGLALTELVDCQCLVKSIHKLAVEASLRLLADPAPFIQPDHSSYCRWRLHNSLPFHAGFDRLLRNQICESKICTVLETWITEFGAFRQAAVSAEVFCLCGSPSNPLVEKAGLTVDKIRNVAPTTGDRTTIWQLSILSVLFGYVRMESTPITALVVSLLHSWILAAPYPVIALTTHLLEDPDPPVNSIKAAIRAFGKVAIKDINCFFEIAKPVCQLVILKAIDPVYLRLRRRVMRLVSVFLWEVSQILPFVDLERDTARAAVGCIDGSILVLQLTTGTLYRHFTSPGPVSAVKFTPDGSKVISFSPGEAQLVIWSFAATSTGMLTTIGGAMGLRGARGSPRTLLLTPRPDVVQNGQGLMEGGWARFYLETADRHWILRDRWANYSWRVPAAAVTGPSR